MVFEEQRSIFDKKIRKESIMRRIILLPLLVLVLLSWGCEKRKFFFNVPLKLPPTFTVNDMGSFSRTEIITESDILAALDVPDGAEITEINIESLSVRVEVLPNNQANALSISGLVYDLGQPKAQVFTDYPIVLAGANAPFVGLNSLIAGGVAKLKTKLNDIVKRIDNASIYIDLNGTVAQGDQQISAIIHLRISGNVKYAECLDVATFMGGGEDCDL